MQVSSCLHPIRIKDYRTNPPSVRQCSCGRCAGCRVSYGLSVAERIDMERRFWKYCYFFTLTYDDEHLPLLQVLPSFLYHPTDHSKSEDRVLTNYVVERDKFNKMLEERDVDLVRKHVELFGSIPILSHKHLVQFFKKVNNQIYRKRYEYKQSSVRYFGIGEYGPASYRPHYHGFIFFDSDAIERDIQSIIHKAWCLDSGNVPLGGVTLRPDRGTAAKYTSLYSTISVRLPKFYTSISFFRPFSVRSSRPAFGRVSESDVFEAQTFFGATPQVYTTDKYLTHPQRTPDILAPHLESKLFPKLPYFRRVSDDDALFLYETTFRYKTYWAFLESFSRPPYNNIQTSIYSRYLSRASEYSQSIFSLSIKQSNLLARLWSVSRRFERLCRRFKISTEHCFNIIKEYYSRKELLKLRNFYELFEQLVDPSSPAVLSYKPLETAMALYTDVLEPPNVPLTAFPTFRQYSLRINKVMQDAYTKKHANGNKRKSFYSAFYADCII